MFTLGMAQMGALYSGFITNPQDIAPNFAGDKELKLKLKNQINQFRNCTWADQLYWVHPWVCCSCSGKLYHQWRCQQHCQVEECLDHHHCHPHGWDCHLHHLCWWQASEVECSNWWKGQRGKKGFDFGKSCYFCSNKFPITGTFFFSHYVSTIFETKYHFWIFLPLFSHRISSKNFEQFPRN